MSDQSTQFSRTRNPYGSPKAKRHLMLTDFAYGLLVDLATASGSNPSEVNEQLIRHHALGRGIPYYEDNPLSSIHDNPETPFTPELTD